MPRKDKSDFPGSWLLQLAQRHPYTTGALVVCGALAIFMYIRHKDVRIDFGGGSSVRSEVPQPPPATTASFWNNKDSQIRVAHQNHITGGTVTYNEVAPDSSGAPAP